MKCLSRHVFKCALLVVAAALSGNPAAFAQDGPVGDDEKIELKIIHLQHASADEAQNVLQQLYPEEFRDGNSSRVTADVRTNSLIIRASGAVLDQAEALLLNLDQTDSKRPENFNGLKNDEARLGDPLSNSRATELGRRLEWNRSPEFQQYELQAQAAAQAYRQQLAATPRDEKELARLKADLQGAVHSAFHARQAWQRKQVAEMRKRLDEIEKNVSARSQRSNEIIERRVEDLLNPERQWENAAETVGLPSSEEAIGEGPSDELRSPDRASISAREVWFDDYRSARDKAQSQIRPLLIFFRASWSAPDQRMEKDVIQRPDVLRFLRKSFVPVKVDIDKNAELQKRFEVHSLPTFVVMDRDDQTISRWEGYEDIDQFMTHLRNALKSEKLAPTKAETTSRTTVGSGLEPGSDPRKSVVEAENAVISARAAVAEAEVDAVAAGETLHILESRPSGSVAERTVIDAKNESKRKAATLNRVRADLAGKERLLLLAKEHLEAQVKLAELELKKAQVRLEHASQAEKRATQLMQNNSISANQYEEALVASRQAQLDVSNATTRYQLLSKPLPGHEAERPSERPSGF